MIDLLMWIIDSRVDEVTCYGNKLCDLGPYKGADCMVAILKFRNGAVAKHLTTAGCVRPQMHQLHVYGQRATFLNEYPNARIYLGTEGEKDTVEVRLEAHAAKGGLISRLVDAIETDSEPPCNVYESADVVAVCEACDASMREGRPVRMEYSWKESRTRLNPADPFG
jgi:predicted dehydrogenase